MLPGNLSQMITAALSRHLGRDVALLCAEPVGGGCIHNARRLQTDAGDFFLKYNSADESDNFHAETKGLRLLGAAGALRVPQAIATGADGSHAWLLMEHIPSGGRQKGFWEDFGRGLAALHGHGADAFGLDHANFIGRLPQRNTWHGTWVDFFREERLEPQLRLAEAKNLAPSTLRRDFERLYLRLEELMPEDAPALLHGDLWSGNFMVDAAGAPVLIDPAVYYGHREAELAFTRLFGGFSEAFYRAYAEAMPLQAGWEERVDLFNLYPLAVHLNLFGRGYLPEIQSTLRRYA